MKYKIYDFVKVNGVYKQVLGYEESHSKMVLLNKPLQETSSIYYHLNDGNWYDEKDLELCEDVREIPKKKKVILEIEEVYDLSLQRIFLEDLYSKIFTI